MADEDKGRPHMCIQCGTCAGSCPETGITAFNIRKLVRKKQLQMDVSDCNPWYCTSCGECSLRCPRDVNPGEILIELRSALVEEGRIPVTLQKALENTYIHKNPWGKPQSKRDAWLENTEYEIPHVSETESKRLLFSCCIQAYDPRCMTIPVNVATILRKGGLEFGVLGKEEACCGNEIRRIGEVGLFEEIGEENSSLFKKYTVKEIIALSPHCMNSIRNEYDISDIRVFHYTQILARMIKEGLINPKKPYNKKVIYHDPCFLGKQNKIFDEPREILRAINGIELMEFSYSRENSLCCEGGGGRMFYEAENISMRNSEKKVIEAIKKGAEEIVTCCPFCVMTLEDPAKEHGIPVRELSEILIETI
jgi:Fe-S oxidoreductase